MTCSRKLVRKIVIFTEPRCDNDDLKSNTKAISECIQRDAHEIFDYNRNTIEYTSDDGTVVITPHFRYFPTEIISLVVQHLFQHQQQHPQKDLHSCTLVNKQFYHEANPFLWHCPVLSNINQVHLFLSCLTTSQLKHQHHLQKLDLSGDYWTDVEFLLLMSHIGQLKELKIQKDTRITAVSLPHLPRHCRHLTSLTIDPSLIADLCVDALAHHCHQLAHLTLFTEHLPVHIFKRLAHSCPLGSLEFFSDDYYYAASRAKTTRLVKNLRDLPGLKKLVVASRRSWFPNHVFIFKQNATTSPWPHLAHLVIHHCTNLTDAILVPFIKLHSRLEHLELHATVFTDTTLYTIASRLPRLACIKVHGNPNITLEGAHQVARHCHRLASATFSDCSHLSTDIAWNQTDMERMRRENGE